MEISEKNRQYIILLKDIFDISSELGIMTYIWGGFAVDIWEGRLLREHGDLDGFTENLNENIEDLMELYKARGYEVTFNKEFSMLKVEKDTVHAGFNPLKFNGKTAEWKHIGDEGSVFFPVGWLDEIPRDFYGVKIFTAGIKFEYALKTKVSMLNPEWQLREKDREAITYIKEKLQAQNIDEVEDIYKWFWSYNPFWYKRGYDEFFRPTVAYPIQSK